MAKQLVKGNEAVVHGALLGGCTHFFGYPITPASEIAHAAALYFTKSGRFFMQAEDEVNAVNMIYGASAAGARVMTATSGPGLSLMSEGISYLAGAELPSVIVDVQRAGPGLGNIWPEQSDYNMVVKGGGHGNYKNIVFAANSVQELCDFTYRSFELADKYRMTVIILSDAYIGQMMEPVRLPEKVEHGEKKPWAVYGNAESRENLVTSILMNTTLLSEHNWKLQEKYKRVEQEALEYEESMTGDAELLFVSFGISARVCQSALEKLRDSNIRIGLLRPQTLFPFPKDRLRELAKQVKAMFVVEMNNGQMAEDVELAAGKQTEIVRENWLGGIVPSTNELIERVRNFAKR
mgnify:CR=1 FL=1